MSEIKLDIFTDGSYSTKNNPDKTYGAYYIPISEDESRAFDTTIPLVVKQKNVGGELLAAMCAVKFACHVADMAKESGDIILLNLFYDYRGIGDWLTRNWKAKNEYTQGYVKFVEDSLTSRDNIKLALYKVDGHSGIKGNEEADKLATRAYGSDKCINMDSFVKSILELGR
jgi:ribonuclease HI